MSENESVGNIHKRPRMSMEAVHLTEAPLAAGLNE
jgi:hypothetical protein